MTHNTIPLFLTLIFLGIPRLVVADPIHDAANSGDVKTVQRLLKEDSKRVNARTPGGATPLLGAAIRGQSAVVKFLVENGADVNLAQGDRWTPLHAAVCDGNDAVHVEITRLLLEHGAKTEAKQQGGWTPLHAAAFKGNTATMRVLLEKGTPVDAIDNQGSMPLHLAAAEGKGEAVTLLMENGAKRSAKNSLGKTPVDLALDRGDMAVAERLLAKVRVTLHVDNASLADALQQLLTAAQAPYPVRSSVAGKVSLQVTDVLFPSALKTLVAFSGGVTYGNKAGVLEVMAAAQSPGEARVEEPVVTTDPRYRFTRTISRQVLDHYLSRAVTHYGLCSISPEPSTSYFDDDMRMLTGMGAKFIGRAAYAWVPPDDDEAHYRLAQERAQRVHKIDPEIILQAAIFEAVYEGVGKFPVPDWVFTEFRLPVEKRNFRYEAMLYPKGKYRNHWTQGASVPDMSKLETRMYFYYRARRYIEVGFESIHFGQVGLMDEQDQDHRFWLEMLTRVRRYAAGHARRRMVLCDAHTHGVLVNGRLLFDFHSWPLMAKEVRSSPQKTILVEGYYNSIYGQSQGGITPSGWACNSLPYLCEFDCGGSSPTPGKPIGFPWHWGYDCGSWFAHQSAAYRKEYLGYAHDWLRARNEEAWLQMPTRLNLAILVDGIKMWHGNTRSKTCPEGFSQEESIKAIWEAEPKTTPNRFGEPAISRGR